MDNEILGLLQGIRSSCSKIESSKQEILEALKLMHSRLNLPKEEYIKKVNEEIAEIGLPVSPVPIKDYYFYIVGEIKVTIAQILEMEEDK